MALLTEHAEQDTLGGGRFRQTIALKRIAYRLDGNLRRITNALGGTGDPALSIGVDELVQFRVADKLAGQSPVIHFGKGASDVRLTPLATNHVDAVVAKNVVTYPGAWDNADLRLSIGGHIVRKEILLRTGHPSSFAFRVANHAGLNIDTLSTPDFRILQPSLEGPNGEHIPLVWGVSSSGGKYILTCALPPGDYAGWVLDPTLVLQPDATDGVDTFVYGGTSGAPTFNWGIADQLNIYEVAEYRGRSLIRWSVSSIPASSIVVSATQDVYAYAQHAFPDAFTVSIYEISDANGDWIEGAQNGVQAGAGEPCWNAKAADGAGGVTTAWAGAVGLGTAGTDYINTVVGSFSGASNDAVGTERSAVLTASVVQGWVDGVTRGLLLKVTTGGATNHVCSSDNATAANRPKLTIEYTVPAAGMSRAPIASWCH